jgi:P27 family predicted phage terminase small subunit
MATLTPPRELDKTAKAAWKTLVKLHEHLRPEDGPILYVYAVATSTLRLAQAQLAKEGLTVGSQRGGRTKHPAATIVRESSQTIIRSLRELRCSPATRQTMSKTPDTEIPQIGTVRFKVSP